MCRPSYIFLTSARSRDKSSLLAEEFESVFKSFSTASIRRTCAVTCRECKRRRPKASCWQTFSVLCWSSSTLACNVADACLYSSNSLYAAKEDARENPKRKPITLSSNENISRTTRYHIIDAHPPRIPPTGFLGLGGTPTCAGASSRSTALDDSSRFCVVRIACRVIKVQQRVAVEAITRNFVGQ